MHNTPHLSRVNGHGDPTARDRLNSLAFELHSAAPAANGLPLKLTRLILLNGHNRSPWSGVGAKYRDLIDRRRRQLRLTQARRARLAGVSEAHLSHYLNGEVPNVTTGLIDQLLSALDAVEALREITATNV